MKAVNAFHAPMAAFHLETSNFTLERPDFPLKSAVREGEEVVKEKRNYPIAKSAAPGAIVPLLRSDSLLLAANAILDINN
jgi:hypothetical protein